MHYTFSDDDLIWPGAPAGVEAGQSFPARVVATYHQDLVDLDVDLGDGRIYRAAARSRRFADRTHLAGTWQ